MTHASIPSNKILMKDIFKLYKGIKSSRQKNGTFANFGSSEVGTLALYSDRIVWLGKSSFTIPIHIIVNITMISSGFKKGMDIVIDSGELIFEDYDPKDPMPTCSLILPGESNTSSYKKVDSWIITISKLRNP
jgi:hypothetical protein